MGHVHVTQTSGGPNLAEWLTGFGTTGTLAVGLFLFFRDSHDRRRAQASRISLVREVIRPKTPDGEWGCEYTVVNVSDQPIWELVWCDLHTGNVADDASLVKDVLLPQESYPYRHSNVYLYIEFRDNAGRLWRRDQRGHLQRSRSQSEDWTGLSFPKPYRSNAWLRLKLRRRRREGPTTEASMSDEERGLFSQQSESLPSSSSPTDPPSTE